MAKGSITQMWEEYPRLNPHVPDDYEAWAFGDSNEMANQLADLVVEGKKQPHRRTIQYMNGKTKPYRPRGCPILFLMAMEKQWPSWKPLP
ncbi:hypothetical protein [Halobacillus sp. K22]|uniref:hypothetical protein n=1 Tax=Halobacillus sp. K22 TaxID=3457431 RepID=UPI003FCC36C3